MSIILPMSPEQVREKLGLKPDWRGRTTQSLCVAIAAADAGATAVFVIHRLDRRTRVRDEARRMLGTIGRVDLAERLIFTTEEGYDRELHGRSGVLVHDAGQAVVFVGHRFSPWIDPGHEVFYVAHCALEYPVNRWIVKGVMVRPAVNDPLARIHVGWIGAQDVDASRVFATEYLARRFVQGLVREKRAKLLREACHLKRVDVMTVRIADREAAARKALSRGRSP